MYNFRLERTGLGYRDFLPVKEGRDECALEAEPLDFVEIGKAVRVCAEDSGGIDVGTSGAAHEHRTQALEPLYRGRAGGCEDLYLIHNALRKGIVLGKTSLIQNHEGIVK